MTLLAGTLVIFCKHADGSGKRRMGWIRIEGAAEGGGPAHVSLCQPCEAIFKAEGRILSGYQSTTLESDLTFGLPTIH